MQQRCPRLLTRAGLVAAFVIGAFAATLDAQSQGTPPGKSRPRTRTRPDAKKDRPAPEVVDLRDFRLRPSKQWKLRPLSGSSAMRKAQFVLPPPKGEEAGEIVVYFFGQGGAGTAEQNIIRWKGMFARPAEMSQEEFAQRKDLVVDEMKVITLEVRGSYLGPSFQRAPEPKHDHMMLTAVVQTEGGTYYLRGLGSRKTLEHWKKAWTQMISTLENGKNPPLKKKEPEKDG